MKNLVLTLILALTSTPVFAQWAWAKVLPKKHTWIDARMDSEGNFYILSNGNWPSYPGPFAIYKLDEEANQIKQTELPANLNVTGFEIRPDNKLFICGYFSDTLNLEQFVVVSRGKEDGILIEIDNTLQVTNVRVFGGKLGDRLTALTCDKNNRIFVVGAVCDTAQIHDEELICNNTGNSFLARFSRNLDLQYVFKDSTSENIDQDRWMSFSSVHVNYNDEILITAVGMGKDFYSFRGTSINVPPNTYNDNFKSFTIKLDSNVNIAWQKVHYAQDYFSQWYEYTGFTTNSLAQFNHHGQPGYGYSSQLDLFDSNGNKIGTDLRPWGNKYSLGVSDDRFYFHRRYEVLDTTVKDYVQRNELFGVVDSQAVLIDTVTGGIGSCRLLKGQSGDAYLVGIFIGPVSFGSHTISTGVGDHKVFIAKLGQSFHVGFKENGISDASIKVWPNPSEGRLRFSENLSADAKVFLISPSGQKIEYQIQSNEIILPEMSAGLYMVVFESANSRVTKKVLIR